MISYRVVGPLAVLKRNAVKLKVSSRPEFRVAPQINAIIQSHSEGYCDFAPLITVLYRLSLL
jgi:hypothetical protein